MKLYEGLNSRIATAFCLTIAGRVVNELLSVSSEVDAFKSLLVVTIIVNFITSKQDPVYADSPVAILRQVTVIALASSLMKIAKVEDSSTNPLLFWTPWAPLLQSLTRTILLVVGISWVSSSLLSVEMFKQFTPEIERISYSLQFLFADEVSPLVSDPVLRRVTFVLGLAGLQIISRNFNESPYSVTSVLYNSGSMVWANVVMNILSPNTSQVLALTLTVNTTIACGLSVFSTRLTVIQQLLPYIEWYVARDLVQTTTEGNVDLFTALMSAILISSGLAAYMRSRKNTGESDVSDTVLRTCINISAVLTSNLIATEIIKRFDNGIINVSTGAIFATMLFRVVLGLMRKVVGDS